MKSTEFEKEINKAIKKVEKAFQYLKMNFGEFMARITPTWKMRKLHLWWFHKVHGNAFRRINKINDLLFEEDATTYYCNFCGKVVFKGSLKYGIVLNCPNCGHLYSVVPEFPHKFKRMKMIRVASSRKDKVDENSKLLRK